ncbi:MAG: hypothetical protein B7Z37_21375 [Verrucomicrobia bacterium 12-59-8]|nr:MAG: hypothetical protein B7Z37_21375 [Verrucomicrobia bacterium 12-59-8]
MKHLVVSIAIASSLSSCTMTGDPSEGGLFNWSQGMSNDRISARHQYNQSIKADTAAKRAEARRIESQMKQ